jgi:hypothetical protein
MTTRTPEFVTRQPTGLPSWPIGLVAGVEKSGKTWKLVEASSSKLINRTFWIGVGEDDPDEYGILPGARFEIVQHDGTYRGILNALIGAAAQEPGSNGEPNLIVLDSITRLWTLLCDSIQETQNERWAKKNQGKQIPDDGIRPTIDLWNLAKDRWGHCIDVLRKHQGPSLVTARLELISVMEDGQPTKEKWWKAGGEKNLVYEAGFIVQMRASFPEHDDHLSGVKSARYNHPVDSHGKAVPVALPEDWTVESLWERLGLKEASSPRQHAHTVPQSEAANRNGLLEQIRTIAVGAGLDLDAIATDWAEAHDGQPISETTDIGGLEVLLSDVQVRAERKDAEPGQDAPEASQEAPEAEQPAAEPEQVDDGKVLLERIVEALKGEPSAEELRSMYAAARAVGILDELVDGDALGGLIMERGKKAANQ